MGKIHDINGDFPKFFLCLPGLVTTFSMDPIEAAIPPGLPQLRRPLQRRQGAAQCFAPRAARGLGRGDRCGGEGAADLPGVRAAQGMGGIYWRIQLVMKPKRLV